MAQLTENLIPILAYVFTILSGAASIALTVHKMGLTTWKKVTVIVGVFIVGLLVVFIVIPNATEYKDEGEIAVEVLEDVVEKEFISWYTVDRETNEVNFSGTRGKTDRLLGARYKVRSPDKDAKYDVFAYAGESFEVELNGDAVTGKVIPGHSGDGTVVIIYGNPLEAQEWPTQTEPFKVFSNVDDSKWLTNLFEKN